MYTKIIVSNRCSTIDYRCISTSCIVGCPWRIVYKLTNNATPYFQTPRPILDTDSVIPIPALNHNYNIPSRPIRPSTIQYTPMYNRNELSRTNTTLTIPPSSLSNSVNGYFRQFSPDEQNLQSYTPTGTILISINTQANV